MRSLPSSVYTDLALDGHTGIAACVEIRTETPIYRTPWSSSITFDGLTYTADFIQWDQIGGALRPSSPSVTMSVQNVRDPSTDEERPWSQLLADEDLNGVEVDVRIVLLSALADATAQIDETLWRIRSASLRGSFCDLVLGPPYDLGSMNVPYPSLRANRCMWEFKDRFCKSESTTHSDCPGKSLVECMARHAQQALRFSQYPYDTDMRHSDA